MYMHMHGVYSYRVSAERRDRAFRSPHFSSYAGKTHYYWRLSGRLADARDTSDPDPDATATNN